MASFFVLKKMPSFLSPRKVRKVVRLGDVSDLILFVLSRLSARFLSRRGEEIVAVAIGDISYLVFWGRRRLIAERLAAYFGSELASHQIKELTREVFRKNVVEKLSLSAIYRNDLRQGVTFTGLEHLHEALTQGKGVILWEGPFGKRLFAKAALTEQGFAVWQVHGQSHGGSSSWLGQRIVRRFYRKAWAKLFPEIIDIQDDSLAYLRLLADRLKQNGIVCINGMGQMGHKLSPVEFMGVERDFATGPVSLAKVTGAAIIPIFCFRDDDMDRVVLESPINLVSSQDRDSVLAQGVRTYADLLESYIRAHPAQWCRWHRWRISAQRKGFRLLKNIAE